MSRVFIYDTTLRDGSQGEGVNFSLQDKLLLTRRLDEIGVDFVEGGYPLSNPKDLEYFQSVRELPLTHTKVVAFGMTRRRDFQSGLPSDAASRCRPSPLSVVLEKRLDAGREPPVRRVVGILPKEVQQQGLGMA